MRCGIKKKKGAVMNKEFEWREKVNDKIEFACCEKVLRGGT